MTRVLVFAVLLAALPGAAQARRHSNANQQDESLNFSKHFDDEVKYERDHPKTDDDGTPLPQKKRSSSSSHRRRAPKPKAPPAPTPEPQ